MLKWSEITAKLSTMKDMVLLLCTLALALFMLLVIYMVNSKSLLQAFSRKRRNQVETTGELFMDYVMLNVGDVIRESDEMYYPDEDEWIRVSEVIVGMGYKGVMDEVRRKVVADSSGRKDRTKEWL